MNFNLPEVNVPITYYEVSSIYKIHTRIQKRVEILIYLYFIPKQNAPSFLKVLLAANPSKILVLFIIQQFNKMIFSMILHICLPLNVCVTHMSQI